MERDMNLIREILLFLIKEGNGNTGYAGKIEINDYERDKILYNVKLLADANFIELGSPMMGGNIRILKITNKGHDFIDSIENKYIWDEVKNDINEKGFMNASLDIIKDFADKVIRNKLDL